MPLLETPPPFFTRYGFVRTKNPEAPLEIHPYPEICHRGVLRPTVIASAIDIVGSLFARRIAGTDATFTADLSLRAPARRIPDRVLAKGCLIRRGRRLLTTSVELETEEGSFAYGQTTFARIERPAEEIRDLGEIGLPDEIEWCPLERPLEEEVGIRAVEGEPGLVELGLRETLRNPEGVLQGALIALITEVSAELLADSIRGRPQIITEMDIRYLSTVRTGPVIGRARSIGPREAPMLRVDLYDEGNDDRLTTSSLIRFDDAPGFD